MLNLHVFMYEHGNGSTNHFGISLIEYYKKIYFEIYDEVIGSILDKAFLKISQSLQENICARVPFLINFQASTCNFIKKETLA